MGEIFLDVIEKLNLLVSANGTLLRSEILGSLKMRSYLSGMPELKLGLNDKLLFEATGRRAGARPVKGQGGGDGRHQVPPVRPPRALRERPHHLFHPSRRRVRADELPSQHAGEASDLDRGRGGAALA